MHFLLSYLKKICVILFLLCNKIVLSSGGYDNGTPAGKGNLDIEMTLNPLNHFGYGQSYVVWGYGLTNKIDFHGYASHPASGVNQLYCGFLYNFMSNKYLDLSTAFGLRFRNETIHSFFPQLLYTVKLPKGFDIIGSTVLVYHTSEKFSKITTKNINDNYQSGFSYDFALRVPIPLKKLPSFISGIKIAIGTFRGVSRNWYPTYSVDFRFNLSKKSTD